MKRQFWQAPVPRLEGEHGIERRVTWLELFFDLFFVIVIARIAHDLASHPGTQGFIAFVMLLIPVWWVWVGSTYYNERFETEGFENRAFAFALMIPVAGMAIASHGAFAGDLSAFALSYAVARGLLVLRWMEVTVRVPMYRPIGMRVVAGFGVAIAMVVASAFMEGPPAWALFGAALLLELLTPLTTISKQRKLPKFSTSKHPERFGLLTIIVLGETVAGAVNGLSEHKTVYGDLVAPAILGLAVGFCLWWIYFDFVARRPFKPEAHWVVMWTYLHLPLVIGVVATGSSLIPALEHPAELTQGTRLLLACGVGLSLISIGLLEWTLHRGEHEPTHPNLSPGLKIASGLIAAAVGFLMPGLNAWQLLSALVVLLMVQMAYGLWVWFTQDLPEPADAETL